MSVKIDLTGKEFGNLEVIRLAVDIPGKKKKWLCRCKNCGSEVIVQGSNLQSGHSTQCKLDVALFLMDFKKILNKPQMEIVDGEFLEIKTNCI